MSSKRRPRLRLTPGLPLYLCSVAACAFTLAQVFVSALNSIGNGGNWLNSEGQLEKSVPNGRPALRNRFSIIHNHANLEFLGMQELMLKECTGSPRSIEFQLYLGPNSAATFLFNRDDRGFDAIRFSVNERFPPAFVSATDEGKFTRYEPMPELGAGEAYLGPKTEWIREWIEGNPEEEAIPTLTSTRGLLSPRTWGRVRLEKDGQGGTLFQAYGGPARRLPVTLRPDTCIGFRTRSQNEEAFVDNVVIRYEGARREFSDDFSGSSLRWPVAALLALTLLLFQLRVASAFRRKPTLGQAATLNFFLASSAISLIAVDWFWWARQYWRVPFDQEQYLQMESPGAPVSRSGHVRRVLFLGGPQTWGAGAKRSEGTTVKRVEEMVSRRLRGSRIEFVNGASGASSVVSIRDRLGRMKAMRPEVVVYVQSIEDDASPARYRSELSALARLTKSIGAKLILASASYDPPDSLGSRNRGLWLAAMRSVASAEGAALVDLHGCLNGRRNDGFLWWSSRYLTSYGQEVAAECLLPELLNALRPP